MFPCWISCWSSCSHTIRRREGVKISFSLHKNGNKSQKTGRSTWNEQKPIDGKAGQSLARPLVSYDGKRRVKTPHNRDADSSSSPTTNHTLSNPCQRKRLSNQTFFFYGHSALIKTTGEKIRDGLKIAGWILAPLAFILLVLMILPMGVPTFPPPRDQPLTFEAAMIAFDDVSERDRFFVNDVCVATLMHHERKTERVYVLMHGLSNCPAQFERFAKALYAEGHNVLIPRMPSHGLMNRFSDEPAKLKLRDVAEWAAESLEIAHGLGENIIVAGLSVNGTTASWIAQERPDVMRVVTISPTYAPRAVPSLLQGPLGRLLVRLPNVFLWWDAGLKQDLPGPTYAAPRFPTRVIGEFMVLGNYLKKASGKSPPGCRQIRVVLSDADIGINLPLAKIITTRWKKWPDRDVKEMIFPAELKVPHDMVDFNQPDQQLEISEPALLKILMAD